MRALCMALAASPVKSAKAVQIPAKDPAIRASFAREASAICAYRTGGHAAVVGT